LIHPICEGIELDYNNKALWAALTACEDAYKLDKEQRFKQAEIERKVEEERFKRKNEIREEIFREKQEAMLDDFLTDLNSSVAPQVEPTTASAPADEDDLLASFFSDVSAGKPESKSDSSGPVVPDPDGKEADSEVVLTEKYAQQDLGSGRDQCERLLAKHYEWRNLNPYYVLQLDVDANEEDIKFRYKKLSLKVHPDRLRDIANARDAFEQVKEAYARLMDPDQRKTVAMHIENVTLDLLKDRKKLISKGVS